MGRRRPLLILLGVGLLAVWWWRCPRFSVKPRQLPPPSTTRSPALPNRPPPPAALRLSPGLVAPEPAEAAGAFGGVVLASGSSAGVPRATLTFSHAGTVMTVTTNERGGFRFSPPQPGEYQLQMVAAPHFTSRSFELEHSPIVFVARAGVRIDDITIFLDPELDCVAAVVDGAGRPLAGAEVRLVDSADGAPLHTDARGEVHLRAAAGALVEARHAGYTPATAVLDLSAAASRRLVLRLRDAGGRQVEQAALAGTVVDPGGAGVEGALVVATARPTLPVPSGEAVPPRRTTSGPEGHFTLPVRGDENYTVVASAGAWAPATATGVRAPRHNLILQMQAGRRLQGTVREAATGKPIGSFSIVAALEIGPLERGRVVWRSIFDADGRYDLGGLEAAAYSVRAVAFGYAPSAAQRISLSAADGRLDFALARGGRLSGRVVDRASSAPLRGASVTLEGSLEGVSLLPTSASTITPASGGFQLDGIAPGRHSLAVAAAEHHGRVVSGLDFAGEEHLGPLTIDLAPTRAGEEPRTELVGIGAMLAPRGDGLAILKIFPGGGAELGGLREGDVLLALDGERIVEFGFEPAVQRIRGAEGSTITISGRRASGEPFEIVVVRRRITG